MQDARCRMQDACDLKVKAGSLSMNLINLSMINEKNPSTVKINPSTVSILLEKQI